MNKIRVSLITVLMILAMARGATADELIDNTNGSPAAGPLPSERTAPSDVVADEALQSSVAGSEALDLAQLFNQAFENNPQIREAKAQWQAADAVYPQATSRPDPSVTFTWFPGSGTYEAELMQMVPNPRRTDLQGDRALAKAEMARLNFERTVRDVLVNVMNSYYELGYLDRAVQVAQTNRDLFAQIVDLANLQYGQGDLGASEKSIAESRLAQADYELQLLQEQLYTEQANMRSLLGISADAPVGRASLPLTEPVELDLDWIRAQVGEHRQELALAGLSVDAASTDVLLAKALASPDFSFGLMFESMAGQSMGVDEMGDPLTANRDNNLGITFGLTIPLWGGKNDARISQAQAELEASQAELDRQTGQAAASADRLYYRIQNLSRLVSLYNDTLIPQATQAADLAQTWYESGQSSFTDLIESRLVVENFQLAGARAHADYLIAMAELQRLIGAPAESIESSVQESPEVTR